MSELYAIAGNTATATLLLRCAVPYLQLRFKGTEPPPAASQIQQWVQDYPRTKLIVNDDLELALSSQAWGVQLGQDDLQRYAPHTLRTLPIALGISTHTDAEIAAALALNATQIGFGPIFATHTKQVAHPPQGVDRLRTVVESTPIAVIAIGGIQPEQIEPVRQSNVAMIAMIGALAQCTETRHVQRLIDLVTGNARSDQS